MALGPGARFGAYEITSRIGAGGMGEVFRARDTTLGRDVAVKVLPEAFATDGDRLARLEREARTLASLNHPNIATIHGFEQVPATVGQPAVRALVLELVEGQTLEELIDAHRSSTGGVPVGEALGLARQILDALDAAHEHGVVHRDLKPANIKVRPDGVVKVLDFGLAKLVEPGTGASSAALSFSPTMTSPALMTGAGVILGTAAYMAPEQARGRAVDKRADIWAFGCVLYEMLTGRRPFDGEDVAAVLAGVIKSDPDWTLLPPDVPASVRTVLERCLQKDPKQRLRDVGDVRLALEGVLTTREVTEVRVEVPAAAPAAVRAPWWRRAPVVAGAALTLGAAAAGATAWQIRTPEAPRVTRLTIAHDGPEPVARDQTSNVTITPDGRRVVYLAGPQGSNRIYVRSLDSLVSAPVATGDGNVFELSASPDGQWVGFTVPGQTFRKVSLDSATVVTVVETAGGGGAFRGVAWTPDGRVVLGSSNANGLRAYAASGGSEFEQITRPEPNESHQRPALLPGGRALLFASVPTGQPGDGQVSIVDLSSGAIKKLFPGSMPVYVPTGHIVSAFEGSLRAVAFDAATLQVRGSPVTVADGVATTRNGSGNFAVSGNGTLVYVAGRAEGGARRLVWVDRTGTEEPLAAPERAYAYARLSPDGARIALDVRDQQNDIWVWDVVRQTLTRLTFDPGLNRLPVWTPDGRRIAYSVARDDSEAAFWKAADGSGAPEELQRGEEKEKIATPMAFTPDGATFLFTSPTQPPFNIWRASVTGDRKAERVLDAEFSETNAEVSHDGRWMAYQSNESGRDEVYVRPWPDVNAGRWQVSTGGGTRPLWSRDGRELFYYWQGAVMSVPLRAGATFSAGTPAVVIKGDYLAPQAGRQYDVSPDGKRFLLIKNASVDGGAQARNQIVVVQNWFEELKRLVPVD